MSKKTEKSGLPTQTPAERAAAKRAPQRTVREMATDATERAVKAGMPVATLDQVRKAADTAMREKTGCVWGGRTGSISWLSNAVHQRLTGYLVRTEDLAIALQQHQFLVHGTMRAGRINPCHLERCVKGTSAAAGTDHVGGTLPEGVPVLAKIGQAHTTNPEWFVAYRAGRGKADTTLASVARGAKPGKAPAKPASQVNPTTGKPGATGKGTAKPASQPRIAGSTGAADKAAANAAKLAAAAE